MYPRRIEQVYREKGIGSRFMYIGGDMIGQVIKHKCTKRGRGVYVEEGMDTLDRIEGGRPVELAGDKEEEGLAVATRRWQTSRVRIRKGIKFEKLKTAELGID